MSQKISHHMKNVFTSSVSNEAGETGCTVIYFPEGATGAVDVRGGSVATREDNSISFLNMSSWVDAIVLAGGSTYGLEAASGVMQSILKQRKFSTAFNDIPSVPSACVYDFRHRKTSTYPDVEMGKKAFDQLNNSFVETGAVGAGTNVYVGKILENCKAEKSGLGAAYIEANGFSILAVTAVNALGNILNFNGEVIRGSLAPDGKRKSIIEAQTHKNVEMGNTTISCLVVNAKLSKTELNRLAVMVHTSMAKVIEPFHTPYDGDVLYAVVPNDAQVEVKNFMDLASPCILAMQKAVLSTVEI